MLVLKKTVHIESVCYFNIRKEKPFAIEALRPPPLELNGRQNFFFKFKKKIFFSKVQKSSFISKFKKRFFFLLLVQKVLISLMTPLPSRVIRTVIKKNILRLPKVDRTD